MINIKDISIGNWVFYNGGKPQNSFFTQVNGDVLDQILRFPERFYGIELESSILEDLGFKKNEYKYVPAGGDEENVLVVWTSKDHRVELNNENLNSLNKWFVHVDTDDMRTMGTCELTYLHQFQNFLNICGIEYEYNF